MANTGSMTHRYESNALHLSLGRIRFSLRTFPFQSCAGLADGTMFPNHQSGCKSFYICSNGRYVETRCEGRLLFNERIRACDWPQNVQCTCHGHCIGNPGSHPQITPRPPTQGPNTDAPIIEHHPSNINCENNVARVPQCPPQPCPPENCVLQACVPHDEFYGIHKKL